MQVGLTRQGVVCEVCGFACHIQCREKVPATCPVPPDQSEWSPSYQDSLVLLIELRVQNLPSEVAFVFFGAFNVM